MSDQIARPRNEQRRTLSAAALMNGLQDKAINTTVRTIGIALAVSMLATSIAHAETDTAMQGLDEQVQEIKSDVIAIATELRQLEEKLLYPSDTQVAVFVSLAEGDLLELDSLEIRINDEAAAHHIYSFKEITALRKGGVQRVYTGNLPTGTHKLDVSLAGTLPGGAPLASTQSFTFDKKVAPRVVALTLAGSGDAIRLGDQ